MDSDHLGSTSMASFNKRILELVGTAMILILQIKTLRLGDEK
jgi:hypothetical protein